MNYRHHYHAGNFADVMKHALLVRLARALQRKEAGVLFLDTHAGRGGYDLDLAAVGDTHERRPEHPDGIGRLGAQTDLPPLLADYLALVREFDRRMKGGAPAGPLRYYPGSPWLLRLLRREQDRLALWERQPEECAALRREFARERRVSVHEGDGFGALRALLPPPERRALILIDPPYEAQTEWALVSAALRDGLGRFPSGVYAVWYPLTERARSEAFFAEIATLRLPPTLVFELTVDPNATGLKGCGVLVLNPPWEFEREVEPLRTSLPGMLGQSPDASATARWLVPE